MGADSNKLEPFAREKLTRFAWLSVAVALVTIGLKTTAYLLTGSVGLLSDALESLVNLAGALMAVAMLTIAARPADESHSYGHSKAEYFSSGVEGMLILIAAGSIAFTAIQRLLHPRPLEQIGVGILVSIAAAVANLIVALILRKAGKEYNSVSLTADAHHLLTDVWTSAGVLVGVGAVALTDWQPLDAIVALVVALNIIWTGIKIMRGTVSGLMDSVLPEEDLAVISAILQAHETEGVHLHAVRTRQAGALKFISLHVLVPGDWTVYHGHSVATELEEELETRLIGSQVVTHLEPLDDPRSYDEHLFFE